MNPFAGSDSSKARSGERSNARAGRFSLFLHGLKAGFAHLQTQIDPAKSRGLLFDVVQVF
jgi:hypothetical protein